ncbi:RNA-binding S4 domain-containing protein [Wohlfahrtiimonas larvae]|uniref:RNA-binding S4 domain-containing protein n=1 Tax=Wohlfahrtiimonas larvae TaxID=1157986 RepID=A0ABP9MYP9_9GAMM|nr:RNA-binding S4 domain-containing protein [Wohlfahrtiimonas larvae]
MSQKIDFYLEDHTYIALNDLLKMVGVADSGGSAKHMVAEGLINVNGALELRKTAKIVDGSKVTGQGFEILVHAGFEG